MTAQRKTRATGRLTQSERLKDYLASCEVGNKAIRERHIRNHAVNPRPDNEEELRWAAEGPKQEGNA